jgi:hypothetical protein
MIPITSQFFAAFFHGRAARLGPTVDDDARRFPLGVRVDDSNLEGSV